MKINTKKKEDNIRSPTVSAYKTAKVAGIAMLFGRSLQDIDFIDFSTKEIIDEIDVQFLMATEQVIP